MPRFRVTVADEAGHKLYDESIKAAGPFEVCARAVADARTAAAVDAEQPLGSGPVPAYTMEV